MPVAVLEELGRASARGPPLQLLRPDRARPQRHGPVPRGADREGGHRGPPGLNVETRLHDEDDRPVPVGRGRRDRAPHAARDARLLGQAGATAEVFRHGWFHSGDLGVMDADGYLTIVDRKKDIIITGGENVASREVEDAIYSHPAVSEVAVFGVKHPEWIEAVAAAVVLRDGRDRHRHRDRRPRPGAARRASSRPSTSCSSTSCRRTPAARSSSASCGTPTRGSRTPGAVVPWIVTCSTACAGWPRRWSAARSRPRSPRPRSCTRRSGSGPRPGRRVGMPVCRSKRELWAGQMRESSSCR